MNDINEQSYDFPKPTTKVTLHYNQPDNAGSSSNERDTSFQFLTSHSSVVNGHDYDIPRQNTPIAHDISKTTLQTKFIELFSVYDIPNSQQSKVLQKDDLTSKVTLETFNNLETEAKDAIKNVLSFVKVSWRQTDKLQPVLEDIKSSSVKLKIAINQLFEFARKIHKNICRSGDKGLLYKFAPLLKNLREGNQFVNDLSSNLDASGWSISVLSRNDNFKYQQPDSLDKLITCTQHLTEDVRHFASFIQGNAPLLFECSSCLLIKAASASNCVADQKYYEYIISENKFDFIEKPYKSEKNLIQYFQIPLTETTEAEYIKAEEIDKLLIYYQTQQITIQKNYLTQAVDTFLEAVEHNQPPKSFVGYLKMILLAAHALLSSGDILRHKLLTINLKNNLSTCIEAISLSIKVCVEKTKTAALCFPSVIAVQEMVDSVVDVSRCVVDLKSILIKSVALEID